eukprot:2504820-Alexandrium_andersonii.AAC.1
MPKAATENSGSTQKRWGHPPPCTMPHHAPLTRWRRDSSRAMPSFPPHGGRTASPHEARPHDAHPNSPSTPPWAGGH